MRALLIAILTAISVALYYQLPKATIKIEQKYNIENELKNKLNRNNLNSYILDAIKANRYDEAASYIELSKRLHIDIDKNLEQKLQEQSSSIEGFINKSKGFFKGFISGKADSATELAGSVTSDFTVVGDIRDIYKEGGAYLQNQNYDKFTLGLSLIGLALSATTVATLGGSSAAKVGVSILKVAKKSALLTKGFTKTLLKRVDKSVNFKILKKIDLSSYKSIEKGAKEFKKSIDLKPLNNILKNLNTIKNSSSTIDAIKILKYIDNEKELQKAAKLSQKYKKSTYAVFKTLGKGVFRGSKFVIKKTLLYFVELIGLIVALFLNTLIILRFLLSLI